jgi:hypothetical protein
MPVSIQGIARVGRTLVAVPTTTYPDSSYRWSESGAQEGTYSDIPGAVGPTYVPTADRLALRPQLWLKVVHTYTVDGHQVSETSAAFGPVARQGGSSAAAEPEQPRHIRLRYHSDAAHRYRPNTTGRHRVRG